MSLRRLAPPFVWPYLRSGKILVQRRHARRLVNANSTPPSNVGPMGFVVGCGRSGTTILGDVIGRHPGTVYMYEPYHLWWAIDERLDVTGLYTGHVGKMFFDAEDATKELAERFARAMAPQAQPGKMLIEKTPHNAMRIGLLERLAPSARYVHIVRNGLAVIDSIERLATTQPYRIAFKSNYNQWWGADGARWTALRDEAPGRGHFPDEVGLLETDAQRAAYEWLVSIREMDRHRDGLADRLLEITYTDLTANPEDTLSRVERFLGLGPSPEWVEQASGTLKPERPPHDVERRLPPGVCEAFNQIQERFGFPGRAVPMDS